MWEIAHPSQCVLLELPSRWYLGIVKSRTAATLVLEGPHLMVHDLGDTGQFMEGKPSSGCERTPIPQEREISFTSIDTCQPYSTEAFRRICNRSHQPAD